MEAPLKSGPRFLIAKYAPDMRRMEPRNIGVILWATGAVAARFAGESRDGKNSTVAPSFVARKNKPVYLQWIRHWRKQLSKKTIPGPEAKNVRRSSPEFLRLFMSRMARENYILVDGGFLFEQLRQDEIQDVADQLFENFVSASDTESHEYASVTLQGLWRDILKKSGLRKRADFKKPYGVLCTIEGVPRELKWDNGFGNGVPEALFQRTLLRRDESVNSTFAMLEAVTVKQPILQKERCAAVVNATESDMESPSVRSALAVLNLHGKVFNVSNQDQVIDELKQMNLPPPHSAGSE